MIYAKVGTMRDAGLEARWGKLRNNSPAMFVRNPASKLKHQRDKWWYFDKSMQKLMTDEGVLEGFDSATFLGDMFSIPV